MKLSTADRVRIWSVINSKMAPDDKDPAEVIRDRYHNKLDAYLISMANWHKIKIHPIRN